MRKLMKLFKSVFLYIKFKIIYGRKIKLNFINSIKGKLYIDLLDNSILNIGKFLMVDGPVYIKACRNSNIKIGNNVFFNHNCSITAMEEISIGNNCMFGNNLVVVDHNHINNQKEVNNYSTNKISIGNNVWVGANVVILPGVTIGDGAVVAAGSIVTKDIPKNYVVGGSRKKNQGLIDISFGLEMRLVYVN